MTPDEDQDDHESTGAEDAAQAECLAVELPIDGVLDLHNFSPRDVKALVGDYLDACVERGLAEVRLIHGKGQGVQRRIVHAVLDRHAHVRSYRNAEEWAGGWGATVVLLDLGDEPLPERPHR